MTPRIERIDAGMEDDVQSRGLLARSHEIRRIVFVEEQSVPADLEWDELDEISEHFLVFENAAPESESLGTARMRVVGNFAKAERVAVLARARKLGLGRLLMNAIEDRARTRRLSAIQLNAQLSALPFYQRLGYRPEGEVFTEAGIEHRAMAKALD
jgi:predicted GNAT family N-acyltransferase